MKLEFSATLSWLGEEQIRIKTSKFTDAQKAFILKQGEEGTPVAEFCRKAGISQVTYFNGKKKYARLSPTEMKRLKQLEDENGRLKKIVDDLTLDREMLQDASSGERSEAWSDVQRLGSLDADCVWRYRIRPFDVLFTLRRD